jgi:uncharacterized protein
MLNEVYSDRAIEVDVMEQFSLAFVFSGFAVGVLVGFTGVGGGSLMTPILILLFNVHPLSAVGTDLLFAAVTKAAGTRVHARRGNVDWKVTGFLLLGSVPGSLATILLLTRLPLRSPAVVHVITMAIAAALIITALGLFFAAVPRRMSGELRGKNALHGQEARPKLTVLLGLALGILVSLTSVGAGAIGMAMLRRLYPSAAIVQLIGSDIAHAVPLTLIAGGGHWLLGDVHWTLLASLLVGSIPGITIASRFASRIPDKVLGRVLAILLLLISAPLMIQ